MSVGLPPGAVGSGLPARIGTYPIRGLIGSGSMGVVYLGHDTELDRPVAIKTIQRHLLEGAAGGEVFARRFRLEARAAARLFHPAIVAVHRLGEDEQYAFIVMEYIRGHALSDYLVPADRLQRDEVLCLMAQLLDALQFAHEHGVIHRDIKPANLMVDVGGRLKITDFGIARTETSQFTRVNTVVGSPGYMAPEQYTGAAIDRRVDLFASGVLLYRMLAGVKPFSGSEEGIMYQIIYGRHPPLTEQTGDPSLAPFEPVIDRALAKAPADRYGSAQEFLSALRTAAGQVLPDRLPRERLLPFDAPDTGALAQTQTLVIPGARASTAGPGPPPATARTAPAPPSLPGSDAFSTSQLPSEPPPSGWDLAELSKLEHELMRHVGPIGKVLVRRAARGQFDLQAVRELVAGSIVDPDVRARFIAGSQRLAGAAGPASGFGPSLPPPTTLPPPRTPLGEDDVARAAEVLTRAFGPVARVMTRRAAANADSREQFVARLLDQVGGQVDRNALETELRRRLDR